MCVVESGKVGLETNPEVSWAKEETARIEVMTPDNRVSHSPLMGSYTPTTTGLIVDTTKAAASRATTVLAKETITAEGIVASVDENICSGCGICEALCPYGAITVDEKEKVAKVNEALCKGCGTCCGACPSGAAQQRGFTADQIISMVTAAVEV